MEIAIANWIPLRSFDQAAILISFDFLSIRFFASIFAAFFVVANQRWPSFCLFFSQYPVDNVESFDMKIDRERYKNKNGLHSMFDLA